MVLGNLPSQMGQRSEQSNRKVAAFIQENPEFLNEIKDGLTQKNADLLGDCAEVCTMIAEQNPELIAPLAENLLPLLRHKNTRVRWESMHALALVTSLVPGLVQESIPMLESLFRSDKSTIVRDYAIIAAGNLASVGTAQAKAAYPLLSLALTLHETKFAKHGLDGFSKSAKHIKADYDELMDIAELYLEHARPSIREAAKKLKKTLQDL
ncbi:MAG: HEAT repeat domain-containing protein [Anaerolineaceae bacterium]